MDKQSCGKCKYCLTGRDIWCYSRDIYGEAGFNTGTFGDYYIGPETYVYHIPEEISSAEAAPLQCAGATVYSGLISVVKPGDRVGIIGIGGLGHLAIQFASKLGAEVVVFSTTEKKEAEARAFGADEFYLLSEPEKVKEPIDVLVLTGSKVPDFTKYVLTLQNLYRCKKLFVLTFHRFMVKEIFARTGTVIPLTAEVSGILTLPSLKMFFEGYNIKSSLVASRGDHEAMLKFAAKNGIKPAVEEFKLDVDGWDTALGKLHAGSVRYRAVLVNES
jgi:D-arabinose 1-dehydrogenase-like Zn-dependent alcohol dehydrogenase